MKARFREFVRFMHQQRGLTVMLTSHDLGDIEELCERMVMIDKGRIVYDGSFAEVTRRFGWEQVIHFTLTEPDENAALTAGKALSHRPYAEAAQPTATGVDVRFDSREASSGEIIRDLATSIPIADIAIEETSAESIIRNLYEGSLRFDGEVTR